MAVLDVQGCKGDAAITKRSGDAAAGHFRGGCVSGEDRSVRARTPAVTWCEATAFGPDERYM